MKWAKNEFKAKGGVRTRTEEYTEEEAAKGMMLPFDRIVAEEGGKDNPENATAAQAYCSWCEAQGHPWVQENKATKRVECKYVWRTSSEAVRKG